MVKECETSLELPLVSNDRESVSHHFRYADLADREINTDNKWGGLWLELSQEVGRIPKGYVLKKFYLKALYGKLRSITYRDGILNCANNTKASLFVRIVLVMMIAITLATFVTILVITQKPQEGHYHHHQSISGEVHDKPATDIREDSEDSDSVDFGWGSNSHSWRRQSARLAYIRHRELEF